MAQLESHNRTGREHVALAIAFVSLAYPWAEHMRILGNFSVCDLLLLVLFAWLVLFVPGAASPLARIYRSGYGLLVWLFLCHLLFSSLFSGAIGIALENIAQNAVCFLVLIPCVVFCITHLRDPEKFVAWFCAIYTVLYVVGYVLLGLGSDVLAYDLGNHRYYPIWAVPVTYRLILMQAAYVLVAFTHRRIHPVVAIAWLLAIGLEIVGVASRACVIGVLVIGVATLWVSARHLKAGSVLCAGMFATIVGLSMLASSSYFESQGGDLLSLQLSSRLASGDVRGLITTDTARTEVLRKVLTLLSDGRSFFVGVGLDKFSDTYGITVHNAVLQYAVEAGVLVGVIVLGLITYPLIAFCRVRTIPGQLGYVIYAGQFTYFLVAPLCTNRETLVCLAIAFGLMWREVHSTS